MGASIPMIPKKPPFFRQARIRDSRKVGFRYLQFSETELPEMPILGNSGGSCESMPRSRKHYQHNNEGRDYDRYCCGDMKGDVRCKRYPRGRREKVKHRKKEGVLGNLHSPGPTARCSRGEPMTT